MQDAHPQAGSLGPQAGFFARRASERLADLQGTFDVIVTSAGTITWLPELVGWARSIESLPPPAASS